MNRSYSFSHGSRSITGEALTQFLGSWFGVFPFQLTDLAGRVKAKLSVEPTVPRHIDIPPFQLSHDHREECEELIDQLRDEHLEAFNAAVDSREGNMLLERGTRTSRRLGGISTNEVDFTGVLKKYYREILPDIIVARPSSRYDSYRAAISENFGVVSHHRGIRRDNNVVLLHNGDSVYDNSPRGKFQSLLSTEDFDFATFDLVESSAKLLDSIDSIKSLLSHLENLGHAPSPPVQGLTVPLLPFQLQALAWAVERETTPGGLQAFFYPKLPSVEETNTDAWYNLITNQLSITKPHLVRGGIIARYVREIKCVYFAHFASSPFLTYIPNL